MKDPAKKKLELEILNGCLKGDRKYQKMLYDHFSPKMFSICLRYAKGYHAAEDILQEGYIKIFKNIQKFRGEGSFEGWMKRIFVNTAIEHYRRSVSMYPILEIDNSAHDVVVDNTIDRMSGEELMKLVDKLAHGYRTIFNLYVVEGFPHKEIAKKLSISEGTSKSQLARARYMLQKMIAEIKEEETRRTGGDEAYGS